MRRVSENAHTIARRALKKMRFFRYHRNRALRIELTERSLRELANAVLREHRRASPRQQAEKTDGA